ncbi:processed acidic surface protein [Aquibacillus rhizosphaerae]|uniref:Processed acidic surface protein n=1 Tax=Aquibacillus rhizosphaerae TaxID=3051431 RepID=A0ABT7L3U5_9BACI|nr:processed acidic surface protein [Aquibacillus sp. LR5S19]MDL4840543.1 processed acidic surface protein [Aquibacillus sp. LR5S19]
MKRLVVVFMLVTLMVGINPLQIFAAPNEQELTTYLDEINWTKEELIDYLEFYELTLDDFSTLEELTDFLGTAITEENLNDLLEQYELTLEELTDLLVKNGELEQGQAIGDVFKFIEDLDAVIFIETPITDENLQALLDEYELTLEELESLLLENDDSLENYEYIEDLDMAIYLYQDVDLSELEAELQSLFSEFGLTDEELESLFDHFMNIDFLDVAFEEKLLELDERLSAFGDFESAEELTAEQIAELLDIFQDLLELMELDAKYYLVSGDEKNPISLSTLMQMTDPDGFDLLIELYNLEGGFLADVIITAEMFGSEILDGVTEDIKTVETIVKEQPQQQTVKTVNGAKMPNTASSYLDNALIGLFITLFGIFGLRKWKEKSA